MAFAGRSSPLPPRPARHDSTSRRPFQRATPGHRPPLRPRSFAKGRRSFWRSHDFSGERTSARGSSLSTGNRAPSTKYPILSTKNPTPRRCVPNNARRNGPQHANLSPPRQLVRWAFQPDLETIDVRLESLTYETDFHRSPAAGIASFFTARRCSLAFQGAWHPRCPRAVFLGPTARRLLCPKRAIVTILPNRTPPAGRRSHNQHVCPSVLRHDCRKPIPPRQRLNARLRSPASRPAISPPICGENWPRVL
jgi:hypothetical protein